MAIVVELPRLSDTMQEGVIAKWHVAEGDMVKRGQIIADIETDKATMEFESFDAGTVLKLVASEGDTLPLGAPIAVFGKPGENADEALAGRSNGASAAASPEADEGERQDAEAKPVKPVKPAKPAKPSPPATKPAAVHRMPPTSAQAPVAPTAPQVLPLTPEVEEAAAAAGDGRVPASPLARRLAREHGLRLTEIEGTGPHGRIIKADVEQAAATGGAGTMQSRATTGEGGRQFFTRPDTPMKLSQMRKTIARRMAEAKSEIPHFYLTIAANMDSAVALREQLKQALPDTKISYNDLVIMACARALVIHPEINAFWNGETITRRGDVHVGIAVALDEGLIVPVVRFADQKSLKEIATEARELGTRARDKKLDPSQMSGSTFTISNLGMFGIEAFSAVVNLGEGAILAVGGITDEVVPKNGAFEVVKRMRMTLSCDHRVMDGAMGARFLATLRGLLEQPLSMLA